MTQAKKPKKEKRSIPLRSPGETVNTTNARPSQLLFSEVKRLEDLENQNTQEHIENLGAQTPLNLDAQNENKVTPKKKSSGRPTSKSLDAQSDNTRAPKADELGRPEDNSLGVLTPKTQIWAPKNTFDLGVKTPKEKNLGAQKLENPADWKKYENNRSTSRLALRPNTEILRKFKVFCAEKDLGMTEFFEISGLRFIELDAQSKDDLGVLTPLDDRRMKMMFKSRPFIINLYLRYNAIFNEMAGDAKGKWTGRWTPRDDEAAHRYNEIDPMIVELGIIQTQTNKGFGQGKIQTFKYYVEEIEKVLVSGVSDEMLATILQYHRQIWRNQTKREIDLGFLAEND
jgi:hypothetical protein